MNRNRAALRSLRLVMRSHWDRAVRDLDTRVAGVLRGGAELGDELGLALLGQGHAARQGISARVCSTSRSPSRQRARTS